MSKRFFETDYGYFAEDGNAYVIKRSDTPRPWVNILANKNYGLTISQAGGGFSWMDHSTLSVLTRWEMDLVRDEWGKHLYIRDEETGELWSASPQPCKAEADSYECVHGIGFTIIRQRVKGIETEWTITVPPAEDGRPRAESTYELWRVRVRNVSGRPRKLSLCSHFMWCLGAAPDAKREFHRLFIDTQFDAGKALMTATKNLWEVPEQRYGHWNTTWPHVAYHATWIDGGEPSGEVAACGDHLLFTGRNGDWRSPKWLEREDRGSGGFGRYIDSMAALQSWIELDADSQTDVMFVVGAVDEGEAIEPVLSSLRAKNIMDATLQRVETAWSEHLDAVAVETPDPAFNLLNNKWLMYQTLSARLWGRTGYWQQSGAFGYRDQLQDSQIWLPHAPERCRDQIRLHARHQFKDGTVYHWWHPLSEVGLPTKMTDDLLWLPFVTTNYIKETNDTSILYFEEPFIDEEKPETIYEHCCRSINRVLARMSERGLPLIGEGDWNDGMSGCGRHMKGESVWLAHFLYMNLQEWKRVAGECDDSELAKKWDEAATKLKAAINNVGWDGEWFWRATMDDRTLVGSKTCDEGKIYLNAQTWSVISDSAEEERQGQAMDAVEKHLHQQYGPLLFTPAYSVPDQRVGYLTRYAPGTRENGGLYTHAGVWGIQASCKLKRAQTAWEMFERIAPPNRGMDPELYTVEPYVTPGNVYGPDSAHFGQGGWSWYTGSAAWLRRICLEWILGVRPERAGLIIDPCLPEGWSEARLTRPFRGDIFHIEFRNCAGDDEKSPGIEVDGKPVAVDKPIVASGENKERNVIVYYADQRGYAYAVHDR